MVKESKVMPASILVGILVLFAAGINGCESASEISESSSVQNTAETSENAKWVDDEATDPELAEIQKKWTVADARLKDEVARYLELRKKSRSRIRTDGGTAGQTIPSTESELKAQLQIVIIALRKRDQQDHVAWNYLEQKLAELGTEKERLVDEDSSDQTFERIRSIVREIPLLQKRQKQHEAGRQRLADNAYELYGIRPILRGTFQTGAPTEEDGRNDDEQQHRVTISQDFYLGKYVVLSPSSLQTVHRSEVADLKNGLAQARGELERVLERFKAYKVPDGVDRPTYNDEGMLKSLRDGERACQKWLETDWPERFESMGYARNAAPDSGLASEIEFGLLSDIEEGAWERSQFLIDFMDPGPSR